MYAESVSTVDASTADLTDLQPSFISDTSLDGDAEAPVGARGHRRREAIILPWVALGVAGALGAALHFGLFDQVPLLNSTAAVVIECLAVAALVASWLSAGRRWLRRVLPVVLGGVTLLTVSIAAILWQTRTVTDAYPPTFGVWVGLAFMALAGLPRGIRARSNPYRVVGADRVRRLTAVMAVPLTIAGALMLIDDEYGVWPQVSDLLGHTQVLQADALPALVHPQPTKPAKGVTQHVPPVVLPRQGVVVNIDPPATVSHFHHRPGVVYLPPAYFGPGMGELPILLMLMGAPGQPINWIRAGNAQAVAEAYAAAHHGIAPILVMVDQNGSFTGDTECVDGPQGNAETYMTVDVPKYLIATLHVSADPARWGIVGFSEGGTCAFDLVVSHPDLFRHAVDLGGDVQPTLGNAQHTLTALFGGSAAAQEAHDPLRIMASRHYTGVSAWFVSGTDDHNATTAAQQLAAAAQSAGISQHQLTVRGGHSWQFAAAAFVQILPSLCIDLDCAAAATPSKPG
jgi:S-formylglutathione hydrolase FrmB